MKSLRCPSGSRLVTETKSKGIPQGELPEGMGASGTVDGRCAVIAFRPAYRPAEWREWKLGHIYPEKSPVPYSVVREIVRLGNRRESGSISEQVTQSRWQPLKETETEISRECYCQKLEFGQLVEGVTQSSTPQRAGVPFAVRSPSAKIERGPQRITNPSRLLLTSPSVTDSIACTARKSLCLDCA